MLGLTLNHVSKRCHWWRLYNPKIPSGICHLMSFGGVAAPCLLWCNMASCTNFLSRLDDNCKSMFMLPIISSKGILVTHRYLWTMQPGALVAVLFDTSWDTLRQQLLLRAEWRKKSQKNSIYYRKCHTNTKKQEIKRHGPLTRYAKLRVRHTPGMPGKFFSATYFKGNR